MSSTAIIRSHELEKLAHLKNHLRTAPSCGRLSCLSFCIIHRTNEAEPDIVFRQMSIITEKHL